MKWFKRVLAGLIIATLYLNIGYAITKKIELVSVRGEAITFFEKALTVDGTIMDSGKWSPGKKRSNGRSNKV